MKAAIRVSAMVVFGMVMVIGLAQSAPGPGLMNYQGVLRDNTGAPVNTDLNGIDVVFRFFDTLAAGNELLVDSHLSAGTGGVVVTDGLFNVSIGSSAAPLDRAAWVMILPAMTRLSLLASATSIPHCSV